MTQKVVLTAEYTLEGVSPENVERARATFLEALQRGSLNPFLATAPLIGKLSVKGSVEVPEERKTRTKAPAA
jgi:hypothetical protein